MHDGADELNQNKTPYTLFQQDKKNVITNHLQDISDNIMCFNTGVITMML